MLNGNKTWIIIAALLIVAVLLPLVLTGCGPDRGSGTIVCRQFIQYIAEQNFDAAYGLIAADLKKADPYEPPKPTKAPTPGPGETAAPTAEPDSRERKRDVLKGEIDARPPEDACPLYHRCPRAAEGCLAFRGTMEEIAPGHRSVCRC